MDREAVALSQDPPLPVPSSDASSGSLVAHRGPRSPSSCWVTRGSLSRVVLHVPGIERRPGMGSSHGVGRCSTSLQHVSSLQGGTAQQVSHHVPERPHVSGECGVSKRWDQTRLSRLSRLSRQLSLSRRLGLIRTETVWCSRTAGHPSRCGTARLSNLGRSEMRRASHRDALRYRVITL